MSSVYSAAVFFLGFLFPLLRSAEIHLSEAVMGQYLSKHRPTKAAEVEHILFMLFRLPEVKTATSLAAPRPCLIKPAVPEILISTNKGNRAREAARPAFFSGEMVCDPAKKKKTLSSGCVQRDVCFSCP